MQLSELWTPSNHAESTYYTPSVEELRQVWQDYRPEADFLPLGDSFYGIAERPLELPTTIVSVDLCEILRETGLGVVALRGGDLDDIESDGNSGFNDYGSRFNGWPDDTAQSQRHQFVHELMQRDMIKPTSFRGAKAAFLHKWRSNGAYVIANTSTLPGCEIDTMKFLNKYYPGCFQGILLPRNHDGLGSMTKIGILGEVISHLETEFDESLNNTPIIAIDDALHHANDYHAAGVGHIFVPAYGWNSSFDSHPSISRIERQLGVIDSFIEADKRLHSLTTRP